MPRHLRLLFSSMMLTLFVLAAVPLYRELSRPKDIWWTPVAMLVPLGESADRVEIYARGRPLATLLGAGQVRLVDDAGSSALAAGEIGLRFNNFDRVRAAGVPLLVAAAAAAGGAAVMLLLVITGRIAYRPEHGP